MAILGALPQLHILDLSKVSERLPHESSPPPHEVHHFYIAVH